jgi:histidinol dehydrogenase
VLKRLDLTAGLPGDLSTVLPRADLDVEHAADVVRPVLEAVRASGDSAVREATRRFDGIDVGELRVPAAAFAKALAELDPAVRIALETAIEHARLVHRAQLRADHTVEVVPGGFVTERYVPVSRVGLYVPGGRVVYPSSVVMNVVPAQVAGVGSLAVVSPPQASADGEVHPVVLAACALLGIDEVYRVGGAQAIAMLAYGTASCPRVDVITGPGNVYVTAAKRLLRGEVGIDAEAGPTEIAIIADDSADPRFVAADLIAQAEHDPLAACLLITTSDAFADAVDAELASQVVATHRREVVEAALVGQSATVVVASLDDAVTVADVWAAEHLEVQTRDAAAVAARIRNAGAIFVGAYSPVPLGDYLAGSNHVLPTGGTARHTGGLSVSTYLRAIHVVDYSAAALAEVGPHITALAQAEDLLGHRDAVLRRTELRRTAQVAE